MLKVETHQEGDLCTTALVPFEKRVTLDDGKNYRVTFDPVTTEIVYLGGETEIQVGTPVSVSGELFCLMETRIVADVAVVQPTPHL